MQYHKMNADEIEKVDKATDDILKVLTRDDMPYWMAEKIIQRVLKITSERCRDFLNQSVFQKVMSQTGD